MAVEMFAGAIDRDPNNADALIWLSNAHRKLGSFDAAVSAAERAVRAAPQSPHVGYCLGQALFGASRFAEAIPWLKQSASRQLRNPQIRHRLGLTYLALGEVDSAIASLEEAARLAPAVPAIRVALGQAYLEGRQFEKANWATSEALRLDPKSVPAHILLASIHTGHDETKEAIAHLRTAVELGPSSAEAHAQLGSALQVAGQFEESRQHLQTALRLDPTQTWALYCLSQLDRAESADAPLVESAESLAQSGKLPPRSEALVHFALGKCYEDLANWGTAMSHFDRANQLMYQEDTRANRWRPEMMQAEADKMIRSVGEAFIDRVKEIGSRSELPIFVLGMVRSGTSLTEQILSSHPMVGGGGELMFWLEHASQVVDQGPAVAFDVAREYCSLLSAKAPGCVRAVDKAPGNYALIGLIHACLPNAIFIHIKRNPVDNCLSIWKTYMADAPRFSFRRENIVAAYRQYLRYMEHWRKVVPADRLLEIDYEELVGAPERVTRSMIDFCGLPWDDACLRPEENRRAVRTPSLWRVRRPIDTSSVEAWRRYEPWLGAFKELV
jgi:tetratricopeptide (TPR) repeat protein